VCTHCVLLVSPFFCHLGLVARAPSVSDSLSQTTTLIIMILFGQTIWFCSTILPQGLSSELHNFAETSGFWKKKENWTQPADHHDKPANSILPFIVPPESMKSASMASFKSYRHKSHSNYPKRSRWVAIQSSCEFGVRFGNWYAQSQNKRIP